MIDWSKMPKWANHFAIDENGREWAYEQTPTKEKIFLMWDASRGRKEEILKVCESWKDSLESRPNE